MEVRVIVIMRRKAHNYVKAFSFSMSAILLLYPFTTLKICAAEPTSVNIKIDTSADRKLISPYIYGINDTVDLSEVTVRSIKQGGNKLSTYNWENNFSNSGSDWFNTSDNSLISSFSASDQKLPAMAIESLFNKSVEYNIPFTLTTLPMCGYVAADGNGPILDSQIAPSPRWLSIQNRKPGPLSLTPDLTDNMVYIDEYIDYIINKYGKADATAGIKAYALDNEPDLWSTSHRTIHSDETTITELIQKSVELATVIKGLDDSAMVFGGQLSGMNGYISLNDAEDWASVKSDYNWFIDYYLSEMKRQSFENDGRLLDVLDLHYYSEDGVTDGGTVVDCQDYTNIECNKVRMQSTRTLWDSTYKENSWIGESYQQYLPLLPTIQASINKYYSGTKLAFSAYNFGGGSHISGGIAEADVLGTFAKEGVYLSCLNPNDGDVSYQKSAINLFTNYDGNGSSFGNTNVRAETSDNQSSSAYASIDNANEDTIKIILINKNYDTKLTANIEINSGVQYKGGTAYGFNSKSSDIVSLKTIKNIQNNTFSYELAPLSVVELIVTTDGSSPVVTTGDYSYNSSNTIENEELTTAINVINTTISESSASESISSVESIFSSLDSSLNSVETAATITNKAEMPPMVQHKVPFLVKLIIVGILIALAACIGYLFLADFIIKKYKG